MCCIQKCVQGSCLFSNAVLIFAEIRKTVIGTVNVLLSPSSVSGTNTLQVHGHYSPDVGAGELLSVEGLKLGLEPRRLAPNFTAREISNVAGGSAWSLGLRERPKTGFQLPVCPQLVRGPGDSEIRGPRAYGPGEAQASTLNGRGPRVVVASGCVGLVWSSRTFSTNQTSCISPMASSSLYF